MTRPHCLNVGNCKAAKPTSHCRSCSARRMLTDPAIAAKRASNLRDFFDRPGVKEMLAERIHASQAKALADPVERERLREHGRKQYREVLSRPDVQALTYSPQANARRGASCRETSLAWCPVPYRDEYQRLVYSKRMSAAEARAIIEAEIAGTAAHARRAVENARLAGRLKHAREVGQRY